MRIAQTAGILKRINVNGWAIKRGDKCPLQIIVPSGDTIMASEVSFSKGTLVYKPDDPLPCGAKAWIETRDALNWRT